MRADAGTERRERKTWSEERVERLQPEHGDRPCWLGLPDSGGLFLSADILWTGDHPDSLDTSDSNSVQNSHHKAIRAVPICEYVKFSFFCQSRISAKFPLYLIEAWFKPSSFY